MQFPELKVEVISACQLDCLGCAHLQMRRDDPSYQLSLEQLERFLTFSEQAGYVFGVAQLHGLGEPLLWRHFNEGVEAMRKSPAIRAISVTTNGHYLERIKPATWAALDELIVSPYESFDQHALVAKLQGFYGADKIKMKRPDGFLVMREDVQPIAQPGTCLCPGPMLYGDHVFLYCGPPVFEAAKRMGQTVWRDQGLSVRVGPRFLDGYQPEKTGALSYCRVCWANSACPKTLVAHSETGGGWRAPRP